ncbi:MAG: hypothetical protein WC307_04985 [Candidatus Nanoarchaeia archaeon]|jgi:hypothetical protein
MPGDIVVKIMTPTGAYEQILDYKYVVYSVNLNNLSHFQITIKGTSNYNFTKYTRYKLTNGVSEQGVVKFYKSGVLELKGIVTDVVTNSFGEMVLKGTSTDIFGNRADITTPDRGAEIYTTRVTAFIGDIYRMDVGTLTFTGTNMTAKNYSRLSPLQAIKDAVNGEDGGEYFIYYQEGDDYFEVKPKFGITSGAIFTLIDSVDFNGLKRDEAPTGIVNSCTYNGGLTVGGSAYATGTYTDATSITTNGKMHKTVTDRTLLTDAECVSHATNDVTAHKDPINYITLNGLVNVDLKTEYPDTSGRTVGTFALGDFVKVTSVKNNLSSSTLRIIGYTRTIDNYKKETLSLKTAVSSLTFMSSADTTSANSSVFAGGVISGATALTATGNTALNLDNGGASVTRISAGFTSDGDTLTASTEFLPAPMVGSNHTQFVMANGTLCVLNSSLASGWNLIQVYFIDYPAGNKISGVHWLKVYKPGHTHGMDHTHVGPQHTHPTASGVYDRFLYTDSDGTPETYAYSTTGSGGDSNTSNSSKDPTDSSYDSYTSLPFCVITTKDIYTGSATTAINLVFYTTSATMTIAYRGELSYAGLHTHTCNISDPTHSNAKGTLQVDPAL